MARKRSSRPRLNGPVMAHPYWNPFQQAYHDAVYAVMLEGIEAQMRDPEIREFMNRFAREFGALLQKKAER